MIDEKELEAVLEDIQTTEVRTQIRNRLFNQPNLITISSADRNVESVNQSPQSQVGYNSFEVRLPRPALDVKGLQLLSTNIPQCNANIPDTACAFWYYRLSQYSGSIANFNNLFMNRLLPSFYKPELINNAEDYGTNKTFGTYANLSTEIKKASVNDLAFNNRNFIIQELGNAGGNNDLEDWCNYYVPYNKNDILIAYNSSLNKFQMDGLLTKPAWRVWDVDTTYQIGDLVQVGIKYEPYNISTTYDLGDYVINNFLIYKSLVDSNTDDLYDTASWLNLGDVIFYPPTAYISLVADNIAFDPAEEPTKWKQVGADIIAKWDATTLYPAGRYVWNGDELYKSIEKSYNNEPSVSGEWIVASSETTWYNYLITGYADPNVKEAQASSLIEEGVENYMKWNKYNLYEVGERVEFEGKFWRCVKQIIGTQPYQATLWDNTISYPKGVYVYYIGKVYRSKNGPYTNFPPDANPFIWEDLGLWGWDDMSWSAINTYYEGTFVWWNGLPYVLIANESFNEQPDLNDDVWEAKEPTTFTSPVVGLDAIARGFDFYEDINTEIYAPFPLGIGQQPYNPNPKRLLNSILGFSWNGRFNPDDLVVVQGNNQIPTQFSSLYNRLRPVPLYEVQRNVAPLLSSRLDNPVSSIAYTYTADAYCNMVYSSIVNIYANIVGSSNVNTQRNATLLAITSMNCGNLGVAFWDNYVDNPLLRCERELYSIFIEFRDEFDEPFFLSNNAIASLTFKVIYE